MYYPPVIRFALLFMVACHASALAENRTFKDSKGRELEGEIVTIRNKIVTFKRSDGKEFNIPTDKFSSEDQSFLTKWEPSAPNADTPLNQATGQALFSQQSIFKRQAAHIAKQLHIPEESSTRYSSSWRLYSVLLKEPYDFFGVTPSTVSLYAGENGNLKSISAIYANKGDYGSNFGFAEDHNKGEIRSEKLTLREAMAEQKQAILERLHKVLGEGKEQRFGEGKARRSVIRWDHEGQTILLSDVEREYLGLSIIPSNLADKKGKTEWVRDKILKERNSNLVVKKDNGDVLITDIPMVDQGPKGYCVPATFERVMRHMGMSADMYLIAMVGGTSRGGGTDVNELVENISNQIRNKGRRVKDIETKSIQFKTLKRYIDEGTPVMYKMFSSPLYNAIANERTKLRAEVKNWGKWTETVNEQSKKSVGKLRSMPVGPHICMIIGYNEATQEVAVSDSWGAEYELRWVSIQEAEAARYGNLLVIAP